MDQVTEVIGDVAQRRDATHPTEARGKRPPLAWLTPRLVAILICVAVLLVNVLGYGAVWGFNAYMTQKNARADLSLRLTRLQALASNGQALTPAGQAQAQVELTGIDGDLRQLQAILPLGSVSPLAPAASLSHTLSLGINAVDAALAGIQAARTLAPAMQALIFSATHSATETLPAGAHPLTLQEITVAQRALALASAHWSAAVAERSQISPSALQALGDPRMGKLLAQFDKYAPTVSLGLATASATLDWSPAALGLLAPFNILLYDMDSDELRPTGGFLGNYAELTLSGGLLTSGIHLHDVYTLDCPNNVCPARPVPAEYNWFSLAGGHFGLRDSNLNPDFPTFAGMTSNLYEQDTGRRIDVVVAITPTIITDILRVTGPITVPQYNVKVTADNMNATIHYYHKNYAITERLGINYKSLGTSVFKAFDVLLSRALMARVASFTAREQADLGRLLLAGFATKDIQIFVSNPRLEALLEQLGAAGQVQAPSYDNLMVVDTNDGGTYSNADIQETMSDTVALDASGGASHTLTVSYLYRVIPRSFAQGTIYEDFVRVIVGASVTQVSVKGPCAPKATKQSYHYSFGCQLNVRRGARVTVTFSWRTPNAFTPGGQATYRLLIQRQAGAYVNAHVVVTPPPGQSLIANGGSPLGAQGQMVWDANPLLTNTTLTTMVRQ